MFSSYPLSNDFKDAPPAEQKSSKVFDLKQVLLQTPFKEFKSLVGDGVEHEDKSLTASFIKPLVGMIKEGEAVQAEHVLR